jgi:hypothetical protein
MDELVGPAQEFSGRHLAAVGRDQRHVVGVFMGQRPEAEVTHVGLLGGSVLSGVLSAMVCGWQRLAPEG